MADITVTDVKATSDTSTERVLYGDSIAEGAPLYEDTTDNKYKPADADTQATAEVKGIAMTPGDDDDYGVMATEGSIELVGATMAIGEPYVVSANAGKIAPETDLTTNNFVSRLGTAETATKLKLNLDPTQIQHA